MISPLRVPSHCAFCAFGCCLLFGLGSLLFVSFSCSLAGSFFFIYLFKGGGGLDAYSKTYKLKIYIHFIALNISHKYSYLQSSMFLNLYKFCYGKSHLDLKIVVNVMCNCYAMCSILGKSLSLYDLGM